MPSRKASGPISFQRERGRAGENQFGDLLSCDGSQKDAVAKVTSGQDKIFQFALAQNRQMICRVGPQPESQAGQIARARATIVPSEERLSLMDVWRVLMKRSFIILAVTLFVLPGAAIYAFRTKPVYESVSRIEIKPNTSPNVGLQSLIAEEAGAGSPASALQTEILVLQSNSVILQTAQSLDLLRRCAQRSRKRTRPASHLLPAR